MLNRSTRGKTSAARPVALALLLAFLLALIALQWYREEHAGQPPFSPASLLLPKARLAVGTEAAVQGPLTLPIAAPLELDGLTKERVLALRTEEALKHRQLVLGDYRASQEVFGQIHDGLPWWGLAGRLYFGAGERSIEGPSLQSVFVLNPYLLVGADFWHNCKLRWNLDKVTPDRAGAPDFPYLPRIRSLVWLPAESTAEATYELSNFVAAQSPVLDPETPFRNPRVGLIAYNARDLGLEHIYVALDDCEGISQAEHKRQPSQIPQYIHRGGSCGYPGGCNNISPRFPAAEDLAVEGLPARIVVRLWRNRPASVEDAPDFLFTIVVL